MAEYINQHYVPQYYFRLFTQGQRYIHLLLKKESRIILNTSIKEQCAQDRFYGTAKIENIITDFERLHYKAIRKFLEIAWNELSNTINIKEIAADISNIWEAVLFQRARTELQIKKESPAMESMMLEYFKSCLEQEKDSEDKKEIIEQIKQGNIRIKEIPQHAIIRSIDIALEMAQLITDLDFYVLRNNTDYPFIFGDSPVIFYNTYYQNVKCRGVLGAQTPGLQIFYPLDSNTLLMLIDNQTYEGWYKDKICVDIINRSDVSQLNALQLHHSNNMVYFADENDKDYVNELWNAHEKTIIQPTMKYEKPEGWLHNGKPIDGELMHIFEPQLNIEMNLSFIKCEPIKESQYKPRKRDPELVKKVEAKLRKMKNK